MRKSVHQKVRPSLGQRGERRDLERQSWSAMHQIIRPLGVDILLKHGVSSQGDWRRRLRTCSHEVLYYLWAGRLARCCINNGTSESSQINQVANQLAVFRRRQTLLDRSLRMAELLIGMLQWNPYICIPSKFCGCYRAGFEACGEKEK